MTTDWHTADAAYLAHHGRCVQCIAAGGSPGRKERCSAGLALWQAYTEAGMPPFPFLQSRVKPKAESHGANS